MGQFGWADLLENARILIESRWSQLAARAGHVQKTRTSVWVQDRMSIRQLGNLPGGVGGVLIRTLDYPAT